jgi:hypothetical protein
VSTIGWVSGMFDKIAIRVPEAGAFASVTVPPGALS